MHIRLQASAETWACRHWEERNRVSWSQQRLQELLGSGLPPAQLDAALGSAEITSLKSCTGEASVIEIAVRSRRIRSVV